MKKTNNLISNWENVEFESSSGKTMQFKKFAREFKAVIKEQVEQNFNIVKCTMGHFEISGFLQHKQDPSKYIYFNTSDVRSCNQEWLHNILIRTAKNDKDYSGGVNHYTNIQSFEENVMKLYK